MALTRAQQTVLTRRLQAALALIAARAIPAVDRAWAAAQGVDDDALKAFTLATTAPTEAAKRAALSSAAAYYALLLGITSGVDLASVPTAYDAAAPFIALRKALGDGYLYDEARTIGQSVAQAQVRNLTISTARRAGDVFADTAGVRIRGWERNAEAGACPWCKARDGLIFDTSSAADFGHDRCNCTARPLVA